MISYADRITKLPPYIFTDLERLESEMLKKGIDVISLGIGDPDLPPSSLITNSLTTAVSEAGSNNYPSSAGEDYFREAVAEWYDRRFGVTLDPATQVCSLIGSKEGLANVGRLLLNSGDKTLVPDPSYPVYGQGATILCDAVPIRFPLEVEQKFQPKFQEIEVDRKTKILFLNYPSNPTGAVASKNTLDDAVQFCLENDLVLCYDNAYSEISFGSYHSFSALQVSGSFDCTVEFNSCSKMFNMTGYRVGFAIGNGEIIGGLKKIKTQIDSGIPKFLQRAAATGLKRYFDADFVKERERNNRTLEERLDLLVAGLQEIGLDAIKPQATFYLWVDVRTNGIDFVKKLLNVGVVATPGEAFGENGKNYVRFSVTTNKIVEAVRRIRKVETHLT
jgi:LL-diaminopimelate aminotransferase